MAKKVQLEVEIKGNDSVAQASEKTKALRDNIQKLKETLATGGLGEKEYQKANDQLQKYEDKLKKSETATKSLKSQLRELQNDLQSGKLTGKEFDEGVRRAAAMKDQIIDVNNRVKALATDGPDVMLKGFGDMATGIIGGFTAAQGAMALFGSENEDLQKTLVKLQGATALLNGIQQVNATLQGDSAAMVALNTAKTKVLTFVQTRYAAAVGTSTGALKLMRIAGAALGIGLIVAAVGLLIANFGKIKKVVLDFIPGLSHLGELFTKVKNAVMDFVGISSEAERQEETAAKQRAVRSQQLKDEIELMEANGASARELYLAKRKLLFNDLETLKIAAFKKGATQDEIKAYNEMVQAIRILDAEETTRIKDGAEKDKKASEDAAKKKKEANDKKAEEEKKHQEELKKIIEDEEEAKRLRGKSQEELELMELQKAAEKKLELFKNNDDAQKLIRENFEKDIAELTDRYDKEAAEKKKEKDEKAKEDQKEKDEKEKERIKDLADAEIAATQSIQDAKLGIANQTADLLGQLAGKNKAVAIAALAVEKGAAIAGILINRQREVSAYNANPAWSLLPDGGTAIKTTFRTLANIRAGLGIAQVAATTIGGAKGSSGGGGSAGGGGSVQPPNIRGSQTTNEPTSQPATKVFVTETDIRSVTRKVDGIFTQATIQ
jgi:hypothetical protein